MMIDEFGVLAPGACALQFPTEDGGRKTYQEAAAHGEVQSVKLQREYVVVE